MGDGLRNTWQHRTIPILATLLVVGMTAGLAEVLTRVLATPLRLPPPPTSRSLDPYGPNPFIRYYRPFLYTHIPGAHYVQTNDRYQVEYRINARGFRGWNIPVPAGGRRRLLVIGDSMVEGHGCVYERTFPVVLTGLIRDKGWEALNVGVQGASPAYYALNLDRYLALAPDAALVVLYENDLGGDRTLERKSSGRPLLDFPEELVAGTRGSGWNGSAAFRVLGRVWGRVVGDRGWRLLRRCGRRARSLGLESGEKSLDTLPRMDEHWSVSTAYLDFIASEFEARGVRFSLATIFVPVLSGDRLRQQERLEVLASGWAAARGTAFIPLNQAFSEAMADYDYHDLVIEDDGHLTELGHAVAARALARWLGERLAGDGLRRQGPAGVR
jgi:lysophospholipase L1-like esterase